MCVKTRSRANYHKQLYDKRPVVQIDYCVLTGKTKPSPDDDPEKVLIPVLTAVDVTTGLTMAAVVPKKGVNNYALAELRRFILEAGRSRGVLQTVQEPATKVLARQAALQLSMTTRPAPNYSSSSSGAVERWHRELWGHAKTLKEASKLRYDVTVTSNSSLMTWAIKHCSWLYTRYQLHSDGKTSYERRHGTNYAKPICEFAETVIFNYGTNPNNTKANWDYGIWLGRCTQSDEHYVANQTNVYRTRSIRRLPKSDRCNKELLTTIVATPWATEGVGNAPTNNFVLNYDPFTNKPSTTPTEKDTTTEGRRRGRVRLRRRRRTRLWRTRL